VGRINRSVGDILLWHNIKEMPISDAACWLVSQQPVHRLVSVPFSNQAINANQNPSSYRPFGIERDVGVP